MTPNQLWIWLFSNRLLSATALDEETNSVPERREVDRPDMRPEYPVCEGACFENPQRRCCVLRTRGIQGLSQNGPIRSDGQGNVRLICRTGQRPSDGFGQIDRP